MCSDRACRAGPNAFAAHDTITQRFTAAALQGSHRMPFDLAPCEQLQDTVAPFEAALTVSPHAFHMGPRSDQILTSAATLPGSHSAGQNLVISHACGIHEWHDFL